MGVDRDRDRDREGIRPEGGGVASGTVGAETRGTEGAPRDRGGIRQGGEWPGGAVRGWRWFRSLPLPWGAGGGEIMILTGEGLPSKTKQNPSISILL